MAHRDTQHPATDPPLHGAGRGCIKIGGGMGFNASNLRRA
jgi:hypothetical protein